MGMIKHSQNIQSNKFAISLQFLKKAVKNGVIFCVQINIKVSTSWHYRFWWKWLDISQVPKIGSWQFLQYFMKNVSQLLLFSIVMQNIQIFYGAPVMFSVTCDHLIFHDTTLKN